MNFTGTTPWYNFFYFLSAHMSFHPRANLLHSAFRDDMVTIKAGAGFVAVHLHGFFFGASSFDHVRDGGPPKIIKKRVINARLDLRNLRKRFCSILFTLAVAGDGSAVDEVTIQY